MWTHFCTFSADNTYKQHMSFVWRISGSVCLWYDAFVEGTVSVNVNCEWVKLYRIFAEDVLCANEKFISKRKFNLSVDPKFGWERLLCFIIVCFAPQSLIFEFVFSISQIYNNITQFTVRDAVMASVSTCCPQCIQSAALEWSGRAFVVSCM